MAFCKRTLGLLSLLTFAAHAGIEIDKKEEINGVSLLSGKENSVRLYQGTVSKVLPHPLQTVKNSITNFSEKCNNEYKSKRKFLDQNFDCKYHNDHIVESIVIRDIKKDWTKEPGEVDRYVIGRRIYNRGNFGYYELVKIFEGKNDKNQKTVTITQKMLNDHEAKQYIDPKFEKDSAFDTSDSIFVVTELQPDKTQLAYEYKAETEHWILNKEVSVPQVFASISKSINDWVKTVEIESRIQSRDVASNK